MRIIIIVPIEETTMLNYLLTNYPNLYFILSVCLISAGLMILNENKIRQTFNNFTINKHDINYFVSLNLLVALKEIDEGIYFQYILSQKIKTFNHNYVCLFEVDNPHGLNKLVFVKQSFDKNKETNVNIKIEPDNPPEPIKEEITYTDIGDLVRMKMGLLVAA